LLGLDDCALLCACVDRGRSHQSVVLRALFPRILFPGASTTAFLLPV
jgi:hypothetical protein